MLPTFAKIKYGNSIRPPKAVWLFIGMFCFWMNSFSQGFEVIHSEISIFINKDGYFDVVEDYHLNFTEYKHGIYRDILLKYDLQTESGLEKRRIKIRNVDVPDHEFQSDFDFVQQLSNNFQIKIGDKDRTIIGPQHYQIKYRVYDAFIFKKNQIQFYWNVKPAGWNAVFRQLDFNIHLPKNLPGDVDQLFVYAGDFGESEPTTDFSITYNDGTYRAESGPNFISNPGQSVTVLLNLPPGSVQELKPWWPFWTHYGWTLLLGAFIFGFYWVWNKYGKDDRVVATTSYFPPNGMDPAMAGFLIDDSADTPDLISLLPYWGSRGIIAMEQLPKKGWFGKEDTKIIRLRPLPVGSPVYEEEIFNGLFGNYYGTGNKEILVSSLKDSFYTTMASAKKKLKETAQIYYDQEAKSIQTKAIVGILVVAFVLFFIFLFTWGLLAALALIGVSIFLLVMSTYLVKKNLKGNRAFSELKGFKNFIKIAEENKLKMLLQDSPTYFETTMGYALAFGLFSQWAQKFEALNLQPPSWYSSSTGVFTMHHFANSFSDSMISAQSTMVSSPSSSSGGGSSGGGFGGGGGGSW
jgi:uncharacterized membrane protein YgcG